jgi:Ulp1 family protease
MGSLDRKLFNIDTIQTIEAAVPQQKNYSDCGLYVLQYIESYFIHRASKMNLPLCSTFSEWCEKNLKGSTKRKEILNVINEHVIVKDM